MIYRYFTKIFQPNALSLCSKTVPILRLKVCQNMVNKIQYQMFCQQTQNIQCVTVVKGQGLDNFFHVIIKRNYSKGKDKPKESKGKKKVTINDDELSMVIEVESYRNHLKKPVDIMREEYIKNISLRSTAGSIELLPVQFEGKKYSLQELVQIIRKNPKTVQLNMAAFPQAIPDILQAIKKSGMNLNPQQDGTTLYIPVPKVTREHREILAKNAKASLVKCKDALKEVQNKYLRTAKKKGGITIDLMHSVQDQIMAISHEYMAEAEKMYMEKHEELLGKE